MHRRRFTFGLIGAALLTPALGLAQPRRVRIGVLSSATRGTAGPFGAFFKALAAAGWVEGRNLVIDWRFANGNLARHEPLAMELVALNPDIIFAPTQPGATATMNATKTIPIVFALVQEPVLTGLADSLARPGKNATGMLSINKDILGKRIELLREVVPTAKRIAMLYQPDFDLNVRQVELGEQVLGSLDLTALRVGIGNPDSFDAAFGALAQARPDGVLVIENPSVFANRADIVKRMAVARLPAMYGFQPFTLDGGLMSYSIDFADQFRRAAGFADRILRGAKPGDLPIEQPVRLQLTVNLKTAKALGVEFPQSVLLRADQVIE
ncbi:MAG: ABC transporter substrate-binding protein [Betaproteobacteria bacterium]|nr:ABC transporter substrate-binding protein [Betaproteobacteria bacterium]